MTAPTPRQFDAAVAQTLARLRQRLEDLPELYLRAYGAGHERVVRDSVGKITKGSVATPTEQIVGDPLDPLRPGAQAAVRRACERAPRHLADAENALGAIEREIFRALDRLDPHEGFAQLRYPITVTQAELEEAKAAQQRRHERGEGVA